MNVKEINVNDMTAVIVAGVVAIACIVVQPPEPVTLIGASFISFVAGYVGNRVINGNIEEDKG